MSETSAPVASETLTRYHLSDSFQTHFGYMDVPVSVAGVSDLREGKSPPAGDAPSMAYFNYLYCRHFQNSSLSVCPQQNFHDLPRFLDNPPSESYILSMKLFVGRITVEPKMVGGKPYFKGTRIPVYVVLEMLANRETPEDIFKAYPNLTADDLHDALVYARNLAEVPATPTAA